MTIKHVDSLSRVPIKIWTNDIAQNATLQLRNVASLPFVFHHIAAMPDVHWGMGATVGSVIPTQGAVIPAAVGVDIGCGMLAVQTTLKELPTDLGALRVEIEAEVPHGFETVGRGVKGSWRVIPGHVLSTWFDELDWPWSHGNLEVGYGKDPANQLGTLGGGNHFIELCYDECDFVWILVHSGSRGVGNAIGTYYIDQAKKLMNQYFIELPDPNLAYLPEGTQLFDDYMRVVQWATKYAELNRLLIGRAVAICLASAIGQKVEIQKHVGCCHNYVEKENHFGQNVWITRKGAIRARSGDYGIIPSAMGGTSFIVQGKGNQDSFCSSSHGAGRKCGRKEAERLYTKTDLVEQTAGVECRKDLAVLDEIPSAYKDINEVMANQEDLTEVVHTLKAVLTVKG